MAEVHHPTQAPAPGLKPGELEASNGHGITPMKGPSPHGKLSAQSKGRISAVSSDVSSTAGVSSTRMPSTWSIQDDEQLIQARARGLNWNQISPRYFPAKTPNACRKRHERLMERRKEEDLAGINLEVLATAYMQMRERLWNILAERMGDEKWQTVEKKCFETGLKNLNQAYRSAERKNGFATHSIVDSGIGGSDFADEIVIEDLPPSPVAEYNEHPLASLPHLDSTPSQHRYVHSVTTTAPGFTGMASTLDHRDEVRKTPSVQKSVTATPKPGALEHSPSAAPPDVETESHLPSPPRPGHHSDNQTPQPCRSLSSAAWSESDSDSAMGASDFSIDEEMKTQKTMIVDHMMLRFHDFFASAGISTRNPHSSSPPSSRSHPTSEPPAQKPTGSSSNKRKHDGRQQDEEEDDDEDAARKRPCKAGDGSRIRTGPRMLLACPYFKHDPDKYRTATKWRTCRATGWESVHRLKGHLHSKHALPPHCRRCYQEFRKESELTTHQRESNCQVLSPEHSQIEGFDKEIEGRLKERRTMFRADSEEEKWRHVYLILFPDTALSEIPSPYYDENYSKGTTQDDSPKPADLKEYEAYMGRELPRRVRQALVAKIEALIGPIMETVKNEFEGLIRDSHESLTREYFKDLQGASALHERPADFIPGILDRCDQTDVLAQYMIPPDSWLNWTSFLPPAEPGQAAASSESGYFSATGQQNSAHFGGSWQNQSTTDPSTRSTWNDRVDYTAPMSDLEPPPNHAFGIPPLQYTGKGKGRAECEIADDPAARHGAPSNLRDGFQGNWI